MLHFDATKAKTNFGELLDSARREPVAIDKRGRMVAVMLSNEEYMRFQEVEDHLLALKARISKRKGLLSEEESEALLSDLLNA